MAFNSPGGPFSVPDPLGPAWDDMVRRNRMLQAPSDPYGSDPGLAPTGSDPVSSALNDGGLSYPDWLQLRAQQIGNLGGGWSQQAPLDDLVARPSDPAPADDDLVSRPGDAPAQMVELAGDADHAGGQPPTSESETSNSAPTRPSTKRDAALAYGGGPILDQLAQGEGTGGDAGYDATYSHGKYYPQGWAKPSQLTLDQWTDLAAQMRKAGGSSPIGKYQFMPDTLSDVRKSMRLTGSEIATPELQDRMGREVLRMAGFDKFLAGKISAAALQDNLAGRWSSVVGANGKTHYPDQSRIGTTGAQMRALLAQAQAEADSTSGSAADLAARRWR
jgi:hypothetical protein